jgi:lysophospholipase L1-like esterase
VLPNPTSAAGAGNWRMTARFIALCLACLVGLDAALNAFFQRSAVLTDIVDIQTPQALYAKLDYLRRFDGYKVVLLGDSVVYGRAMLEAGDRDWREHTLSAVLQERLDEAGLKRPVLVMNLGMNGALPLDLERLAEIVVPLGVDKVVLDVTLRSFSGDFASPEAQASRPWLRSMSVDRDGRFRENGAKRSFGESVETALREFMTNHWMLYRMRDFVQWRLFNGEPASAVRALRAAVDRALRGDGGSSAEDALFGAAVLKLKAKNRHDSVNLDADNPQRAAFGRTLQYLAKARQPTVIFYATEDQAQFGDILEPQRYSRLMDELEGIILASGKGSIAYVPPLTGLRPDDYIDYVHPNHAGYVLVADAIAEKLISALK